MTPAMWITASSGIVGRMIDESKTGFDVRVYLQYTEMVGELHTTVRTLLAPLFGTFLQTLPDLVTPLNGHSLLLVKSKETVGNSWTVLKVILQSLNEVNIYRLQPKSATKGDLFHIFLSSIVSSQC